jgi:hypothetical protein
MSPQDATETAPQVAASPATGRKLGLALLVIATAQLMLVLGQCEDEWRADASRSPFVGISLVGGRPCFRLRVQSGSSCSAGRLCPGRVRRPGP